MDIAVFSTRSYDQTFLEAANAKAGNPHNLRFFEASLTLPTVPLAAGAAAVCCFVNDRLDGQVIEALSRLGVRLVALRSAGFNNVDLIAAEKAGICVARVPAYSPEAIAEHTLALILCLNRKIHRAYVRVREGNFALDGLLGFNLASRTIGIIGTGKIGCALAKILSGFGCKVRAYDPFPNPFVHDRVFIDLLRSEAVTGLIARVFGHEFIVSNFSANIAKPGSGSMALHSDQALALPPPWMAPGTLNVIWCLDDIDAENGATRYLPGSHLFRDFSDVPTDSDSRLLPFEAQAGSCVIMEGRLWHTSGANISADRIRRMLFAYYCTDFVRPQVNWEVVLPPSVKDQLDDENRRIFALSALANTRFGRFIAR